MDPSTPQVGAALSDHLTDETARPMSGPLPTQTIKGRFSGMNPEISNRPQVAAEAPPGGGVCT